jgi:hypothetical protein
MPALGLYPTDVLQTFLFNQEHFSRTSALYNSILSIGATGVDNGKNGGFEKRHGDHAGRGFNNSDIFCANKNQ